MTQIAEYDKYKYDYSDYWKGREYEDAAERIALSKLIRSGKRFIDVGGSYGRLLDLYKDRYEEVVIIDYSLETLLKYEKQILEIAPHARLIAANAYKLPFAESSFDGGMMVRVLHHIEDISAYFTEIARILSQESEYIQEFANKLHIKARLKWFFTGRWGNLSKEPYQQPMRGNFEGTQKEPSVFLNFHPNHVRQEMQTVGFSVDKEVGSSFLRLPFVKKILPNIFMISIEKIFQSTLSWSHITPSIFYLTQLKKKPAQNSLDETFEQILICPACKARLKISDTTATCASCQAVYKKHSSVWDLRAE